MKTLRTSTESQSRNGRSGSSLQPRSSGRTFRKCTITYVNELTRHSRAVQTLGQDVRLLSQRLTIRGHTMLQMHTQYEGKPFTFWLLDDGSPLLDDSPLRPRAEVAKTLNEIDRNERQFAMWTYAGGIAFLILCLLIGWVRGGFWSGVGWSIGMGLVGLLPWCGVLFGGRWFSNRQHGPRALWELAMAGVSPAQQKVLLKDLTFIRQMVAKAAPGAVVAAPSDRRERRWPAIFADLISSPLDWILAGMSDSILNAHILMPVWCVSALLALLSFACCGLGELVVIPPLMCGILTLCIQIARGTPDKLAAVTRSWATFPACLGIGFASALAMFVASLGVLMVGAIVESVTHSQLLSILFVVLQVLAVSYLAFRLTFSFVLLADETLEPDGPQSQDRLWAGVALTGNVPGHVLYVLTLVLVALVVTGGNSISAMPATLYAVVTQTSMKQLIDSQIMTLVWLVQFLSLCFGLGTAGLVVVHAYNDLLPAIGRPARHGKACNRKIGWLALAVFAAQAVLFLVILVILAIAAAYDR